MSPEPSSPDGARLRVYLVDDEPLAVKRLARLLAATKRVEIVGSSSDPEEALEFLCAHAVDALFLDIEMPGMNGFDLVGRLDRQPLIVFTTAFDRYALKAFEVNSIDYLLKPIEPEQLERALAKLERIGGGGRQAWTERPDVLRVLQDLSRSLGGRQEPYVTRLASRLGERTQLLEVREISHFSARDKLTYAVSRGRELCIDHSLADLERKLDPRRFLRIHRATMVNLDWVQEIDAGIGGSAILRLKDDKRTELTVARDRVRTLRERLGL